MSRKTNIINYIINMGATMGALLAVVLLCSDRYSETMVNALIKLLVGAILAGLINTFVHEFGHVIAGKYNGFVFSSVTIWFFKWTKRKKKIRFSFVMMGEEAGYTEMIPSRGENMANRLKRFSFGGIIGSAICVILGIIPLFISSLSVWVFSIWSMFFPIGVYFLLSSALPASSGGVRNDGAVIYGLKKDDDVSKVTVNLLIIQSQLMGGKTPSEIDENLYFDLPQLPEDDVNFAMILNARYNYYLDKEDYQNAKMVSDRLMSIIDYLPKDYRFIVKTDALYNACTFDYNEENADDLMYELEKFLNNVNNATTVRVKLAYLLYIKKEKEAADIFLNKAYKECDRNKVIGYGKYERKLLEKISNDI